MTTQLRRISEINKPKSIMSHSRYCCSGFFSCITKPLTTQDSLTMKFHFFFPSSLWYALGGAFCIGVVGIVGAVGVVGVVGMSELFWKRCKFFMSEHNVRVTWKEHRCSFWKWHRKGRGEDRAKDIVNGPITYRFKTRHKTVLLPWMIDSKR